MPFLLDIARARDHYHSHRVTADATSPTPAETERLVLTLHVLGDLGRSDANWEDMQG